MKKPTLLGIVCGALLALFAVGCAHAIEAYRLAPDERIVLDGSLEEGRVRTEARFA